MAIETTIDLLDVTIQRRMLEHRKMRLALQAIKERAEGLRDYFLDDEAIDDITAIIEFATNATPED